jgi:serine/threonine protein kinase
VPDVKPDNLLITQDYSGRVADLGLTKMKQSMEETPLPEYYGTPGYMAPEQYVGGWIDEKADVFAFGMVLQPAVIDISVEPYEFFPDIDTLHAAIVLDGQRPNIPDSITPWLTDIMTGCWSGDPDERISMDTITRAFAEHEVEWISGVAQQCAHEVAPLT